MSLVQRLRQRLVIDDRTTRSVDQICRGFHFTKDARVEEVVGFRQERSMDRNMVGHAYQLGELNFFNSRAVHRFLGDERIITDNLQTKRFSLGSNELRDSAKTNQPQDAPSQTIKGNHSWHFPVASMRA